MEKIILPYGLEVILNNPGGTGIISDGYHTFSELYKHRCLLFLLVIHEDRNAWKSIFHSDGSKFEGWFIAGTTLYSHTEENGIQIEEGKQITYHLPNDMWELCNAEEFEKAPEFDGHTSNDVLNRIEEYLRRYW